MRFLRGLLSVVVLIALIGVLAVIALMYAIDPNKLKPVIAEQVMKQTGYQMIIQGDLTWSVLPRVGVKAPRIMLRSANQNGDFIELQEVHIGTGLVQLFQNRDKLKFDLYISDLALTNLHAQNVEANVRVENGMINIENISANLYNGILKGNAYCEQFATDPRWDWDFQLLNVEIKPLLTAANGESKIKVAGIGNLTFHGMTTGKNRDEMFNNLNGTLRFAVNNGTLEGINLNYYVQAATALLTQQTVPVPANLDKTDFSSLMGSAIINKGIAETNDVILTAPALVTKARGNIVLLTEAIELQLQVKPLMATNVPVEVPVAIIGDFHHPEVKIDAREVQKILANQDLDQLKSKAIEKIKEKIPEAGEFIQKLIGN